MNKFDVHKYVDSLVKIFPNILTDYEENNGINGLDNLWGCEDKDEVDDLLDISLYLYDEHAEYLEKNYPNHEYNFGWAQGDDFIVTKIYQTESTFVESRIEDNKIIHEVKED